MRAWLGWLGWGDRRGASVPDMITCQEALARMYEYLDGELEPEWSDKVRRHVEVCRRCWPRFELERAFLDHVRERGLPAATARGLKDRIRTLLDEAGPT